MIMKRKCVFAGTFDPPTSGHLEIVDTCLKIFDEVVVAVMLNAQKKPLLSAEERKTLLEKLFRDEPRVRVVAFEGAAVDILEKENTPFYVRGVRNTVDFEYENMDTFASKKLKKDMVALYVPASQEKLHISSTLVRNSVLFGKEYSRYIPKAILPDLLEMLEKKNV